MYFSGFFKSYFIAVEEESRIDHSDLSEHERQLLIDYKTKESTAGDEYEDHEKGRKKQKNSNDAQDGYEKVIPKHGDVGFYKFVSAINENPGHVLRYMIFLYISMAQLDHLFLGTAEISTMFHFS